MRRLALATAILVVSMSYAAADTLHGYCTGCSDNGTNTPTTQNPLTGFGFLVDPGPQTGNFQIDILVPTNQPAGPFTLTGQQNGNSINLPSSLVSATPWTAGNLDAYLGFSASPNNPIGAYLPSTDALDPGDTGYLVFQFQLGLQTLFNDTSHGLFSESGGNLPTGSYVVAYLLPQGIAVPNSAALFEAGQLNTVPLPSALAMFAPILGLGGLWWRRRKRMA